MTFTFKHRAGAAAGRIFWSYLGRDPAAGQKPGRPYPSAVMPSGVARWVLLLGFIIKPKGSTNEDLGCIRFYCFSFLEFRIPSFYVLLRVRGLLEQQISDLAFTSHAMCHVLQ
jgi:hypothetical protein